MVLTRRTFFGTLAALAVAPRVVPAVGAIPLPPGQRVTFTLANGRVFSNTVYPVLVVDRSYGGGPLKVTR